MKAFATLATLFAITLAQGLVSDKESYERDAANRYGFSVANITANLTTVEYNTVIFGAIYGFLGSEGLQEIQSCVTDLSHDGVQLVQAIMELEHGNFDQALL